MIDKNSILILAPHTDDAELGCGGTISRFMSEGRNVYVVVFSTCEESLPAGWPPNTLRQELYASMPILGVPLDNLFVHKFPVRRLHEHRQQVLDELILLRQKLNPSTVFLPSGHDMHQDHQVVHAEGLRAFKQITVLGYELPWNNISFDATAFITFSKEHLDRKCEALSHYKSQMQKRRSYFDQEFTRSLALVRGLQVGAEYAEVFEVMRIKI